MQAGRLEEHHGEHQERLTAEDQPPHPAGGLRLAAGERQRTDHDVGVGVLGVGVGVMPVVLAGPPAKAQADAEIPARQPEEVIGLPGAEDLLVARVMAEEAELAEHHGQEDRDPQLPPRITDQRERRPAGHQCRRGDRDLRGVIAQPPVQQTRLPDLPRQHRVLAAAQRRGRGRGRGIKRERGRGLRAGPGLIRRRNMHAGTPWLGNAAGLTARRQGPGRHARTSNRNHPRILR